MEMPRVRISTRRLMILVAVTAVSLGLPLEGLRLKRNRDERLDKANFHAVAELGYLQRTRLEPGRAAKLAEYAAYHAALKRKYLEASDRLWGSVEPDPLPPEPESLALYWTERGDFSRAVIAYDEAIRENREDCPLWNNFAWLLATCPDASCRDGRRAVTVSRQVCDATERVVPEYIDTLAAACAEAGDFKAAIEAEREAIGLLSKGDRRVKEFRLRLEGYEAKKPYRLANQKAD
jgi:tetratricopeptide (TPR) repeat protein